MSIDREAWIRFFIALAGLVFAFSFAVLSTSFKDEGNLLGTAITASLALLTAGAVGLLTVPYLARRVAFERVRFRVSYELTREGMVYIGAVLIVGIAALNTGNNLLFIIVASMLAAVLVSGIASTIVLFGLRLSVTLPEQVFAGKPFLGTITVRNDGRLPSFSVSAVPEKSKRTTTWKWQRATVGIPPFREPGKQWVQLPDLQLRSVKNAKAAPPILAAPVYFPYLRARHSESAKVELRFARRGRYSQNALGLATRFPFSFLNKTRIVPLERELIVLPSIEETQEFLTMLPSLRGEFEVFVAGRGYDLYRLREFAAGDAARHIDWKATARAQTVMVREFTREDERKLQIVFDNPLPGSLASEDYERAVSIAASLAWHFTEGDTELAFSAPGYSRAEGVLAFLRHLAVVEPERHEASLDDLLSASGYNVVVTARERGSIPTELWQNSYFIFMGETEPRAGTAN